MKKISFVIPCYKCENTIEPVVAEIGKVVEGMAEKMDYEVILVDDGSGDGTWNKLKDLCGKDRHIRAASFSKNFGQASAILAALSMITGDYVFCLDDDGQAPVEEVPNFISKIEEGYDVVFAKYRKVKQNGFRNFTSRINAWMARVLTEKPKGVETASFFCMRAYVAENMVKYDAPYTYISGLIFRITHNAVNLPAEQRKRAAGRSGYTFKKLLGLWFNGFTSFSILPLRFATAMGFIFSAFGIVFALVTIIRKFLNPAIQAGYSSTIAFIAFLGGIILFCIGEMGEYIGRQYMCTSRKPQYIVRMKAGFDDEEKDEQSHN